MSFFLSDDVVASLPQSNAMAAPKYNESALRSTLASPPASPPAATTIESAAEVTTPALRYARRKMGGRVSTNVSSSGHEPTRSSGGISGTEDAPDDDEREGESENYMSNNGAGDGACGDGEENDRHKDGHEIGSEEEKQIHDDDNKEEQGDEIGGDEDGGDKDDGDGDEDEDNGDEDDDSEATTVRLGQSAHASGRSPLRCASGHVWYECKCDPLTDLDLISDLVAKYDEPITPTLPPTTPAGSVDLSIAIEPPPTEPWSGYLSRSDDLGLDLTGDLDVPSNHGASIAPAAEATNAEACPNKRKRTEGSPNGRPSERRRLDQAPSDDE